MKKYYALAGYWGFDQEAPMGITSYEYIPESGELKLIETIREDIVSGTILVDPERKVAYVTDEIGHIKGDLGGGGYVRAFRIDPATGRLTMIAEQRSLSNEPSGLCLDVDKKRLLCCHCSDPFHVTKIRKGENGKFTSDTVYDDTAVVMFPVADDGNLEPVCDVAITEGAGATGPNSQTYIHPLSGHIMHIQIISRHHSVERNADGSLFVVSDRGMDKFHTFKVDREQNRLIHVNEVDTGVGTIPRSGVFHPTLPYIYTNYSKMPYVESYRYDSETGAMELVCREEVKHEGAVPDGGSFITMIVHPNGKFLYNAGTPDIISVFDVKEDGKIALKQTISCEGINPRVLTLSPDNRYLFSGNNRSRDIVQFEVHEDGTLSPTGRRFESVSPSALTIFTLE